MISFKHLLTEFFDKTTDYEALGTEEFFKYAYEMYKADLKDEEPRSFEEASKELFKRYSYTVKAFKFKQYVILYGKFPTRQRYEIHFWDVENLKTSGRTNKNHIDNIFSAVMSIAIDKHLNKRGDDLYVSYGDDTERGTLYKKLIDMMFKKYQLNNNYSVSINNDVIIISKMI